jgi:hypothetical protein
MGLTWRTWPHILSQLVAHQLEVHIPLSARTLKKEMDPMLDKGACFYGGKLTHNRSGWIEGSKDRREGENIDDAGDEQHN